MLHKHYAGCKSLHLPSSLLLLRFFQGPSQRLHDMNYLSDRERSWQCPPLTWNCVPRQSSLGSTLPRGRDFNNVSSPHMEQFSPLHGTALPTWQEWKGSPVAGNRVTGKKKLLNVASAHSPRPTTRFFPKPVWVGMVTPDPITRWDGERGVKQLVKVSQTQCPCYVSKIAVFSNIGLKTYFLSYLSFYYKNCLLKTKKYIWGHPRST